MYTLSQLQTLAKRYGVSPKKSRGQNFLIEPSVLAQIVSTAHLSKDDVVLEIGAGFGSLTVPLAEQSGTVYSIEMDDALIPALSKLQNTYPHLHILHNDVFQVNIPETMKGRDFKVVANIPYTITSSFIRMILTMEERPKSMTLLIQKEVAERIITTKGSMSLLALSVQAYSQPRIAFHVPAEAFWPIPRVHSAVITFDTYSDKEIKERFGNYSVEEVLRIARMGFSSKRKTLKNNLKLVLSQDELCFWAKDRGFTLAVRAQELGLEDWISLLGVIDHKGK